MSPNHDDDDHASDQTAYSVNFYAYCRRFLYLNRETLEENPHRPLSSSSTDGLHTTYFSTSRGLRPLPSLYFPVLEFPTEIRLRIFEYVLADLRPEGRSDWWLSIIHGKFAPAPCPALLLVSRQITAEATPVYYGLYDFQFSNMRFLKSFLQAHSLEKLASIRRMTVSAHPKLDFKTFDHDDDVETWRLLVERCTGLRELWIEIMLSSNIYRNGVAGMEVLSDLRGLRKGGVVESMYGQMVEVEYEWTHALKALWKMPKPVRTGIAS